MGTSSRLCVVKEVASRHDPDVVYNVYEHRDTHALSCQCKGWVFGPTCGLPGCGEKLLKQHLGGEPVWCCPVHGIAPKGAPVPGKAVRGCPHIRKHLADEAYLAHGTVTVKTAPPTSQAARPRPAPPPGGGQEGALVPLVLRAARQAGVEGDLAAHEWRRFAACLAPLVSDGLPVAPVQSGLDLRPVRRIYLED